jgi:membrane-associated phospholipid phosphatase
VLTGFMQFMSFIGSSGFYLPVLVVVFWCLNPRAGARAAVVLALSGALNTMLKLLWHAPRPYWTDPSVKGHESRASFGMPSGHAQGSAVAWGLLGIHFRRRIVWVIVLAVVLLVGVSRVYLGVHSIGQVLAGWAIGAGLLGLTVLLEPFVVPWWARRSLAVQVALSLAIAAAVLIPTAMAVDNLHAWHMPGTWEKAVEVGGGTVRPATLTQGAAATGLLCGALVGLSWLGHSGWFDVGGSTVRRLARIPVGMAGAAAIWVPGLFAGNQSLIVFGVYLLLALWATAGAPAVFVRLGLARREARPVPEAEQEPDHTDDALSG